MGLGHLDSVDVQMLDYHLMSPVLTVIMTPGVTELASLYHVTPLLKALSGFPLPILLEANGTFFTWSTGSQVF